MLYRVWEQFSSGGKVWMKDVRDWGVSDLCSVPAVTLSSLRLIALINLSLKAELWCYLKLSDAHAAASHYLKSHRRTNSDTQLINRVCVLKINLWALKPRRRRASNQLLVCMERPQWRGFITETVSPSLFCLRCLTPVVLGQRLAGCLKPGSLIRIEESCVCRSKAGFSLEEQI